MSHYAEARWSPIDGTNTTLPEPDPDGVTVGVLHTTEGDTIAGAEATYEAKGVVPHFTADPGRPHPELGDDFPELAQHVDTVRAASALRNEAGGVETNRQGHVIQIELIGHAADAGAWSDVKLRRVGNLVRLISARESIPLTAPAFIAYPASYGKRAAQRMTLAAWAAYGGWCGHQHVPENDHGDPGALDFTRALSLTDPEGPDMPLNQDDKDWIESRLVYHARVIGGPAKDVSAPGGATAVRSQLWQGVAELVARPAGGLVTVTAEQLDTMAAALVAKLGPGLAAQLGAAIADTLAARLAD